MNSLHKYIAAVFGVLLIVFSVWYFSAIVAYILLAVVVSFIGRPLVEKLVSLRLGRFKISHALAAFITLVALWALLIFFFYYLMPVVVSEFGALRNIDYNLVSEKLNEPVQRINTLLSSLYGEKVDIVNLLGQKMKGLFSAENAMDIINSLTGTVTNLVIALFSITFMAFFFLKDSGLFLKGILIFTPSKYESNVLEAFASIKRLLVRYFLGVLGEVLIIFTLMTIGLLLIGIASRTALVIALIAGLLNIIPYIGPFSSAVIGVAIVCLNHINAPVYEEFLPMLGLTALVFAIVQLIDNILLQPLIYSSSIFAHPLEIFLLILIAGSLAGPIGMILAVPAYTILRVVGYEFFAQYEVVKRLTKGISDERGSKNGAEKSQESV